MKRKVLNLKGTHELSRKEQRSIEGGGKKCGGDGSYIIVNGKKVCCYVPSNGSYIC